MKQFVLEKLELEDAYLINPFVSQDKRGLFVKDYSKEIFKQNNIDYNLEEVFYTYSHKGVIRALHFQTTYEQPKLVRCLSGEIYDVIVDIRKKSPTYKQWMGFYLSGENFKEILIPKGFAHGYLVIKDAIVSYKCAEKFFGEYDSGIIWNDEELNVAWPLDKIGGEEFVILSDKDRCLQSFKYYEKSLEKKDDKC